MASIRILLFLFTVSASVIFTSSQECKHPLPFLEKTASGIDITKLDFDHIDPQDSEDGFVEKVFTYRCNGGKWHDERLNDSTEYDVPDEFTTNDAINTQNAGKGGYSIAHNMFEAKALKEYSVQLPYSNYGYNGTIRRLFTQNRKYQSLLKQYFDSGKLFAEIQEAFEAGAFFVKPNWTDRKLSREFIEFYTQKLPPKYEDNPTIYRQFVQRFGTHFFEFGEFGFDHTLQMAINRQYAWEHDDKQILHNVRVAFYREFNIRTKDVCKDENEKCQVDEDFANNSEIILSYGGNSSKWIDKVSGKTFIEPRNPDRVLLRLQMQTLDNLIYNENIKAQVRIAIRMYLAKAYLAELVNVYNYTNYQLWNGEKASLMQVETRLKENDTKNMNETDNLIDHLYQNVEEFAERKLCYPTLYDLYITANVKSDFAQRFCAFTWAKWFRGDRRHCVNSKIYLAQNEVNDLFRLYENAKQDFECLKEVRWFNLEYDILRDRDNGLKVNCTPC